jgi:hypothetical protein
MPSDSTGLCDHGQRRNQECCTNGSVKEYLSHSHKSSDGPRSWQFLSYGPRTSLNPGPLPRLWRSQWLPARSCDFVRADLTLQPGILHPVK